jgi:hypothetical protein
MSKHTKGSLIIENMEKLINSKGSEGCESITDY